MVVSDGDVTTEAIVLWPNLVHLLVAIAAGIVLVISGYYRVVRCHLTMRSGEPIHRPWLQSDASREPDRSA